MQPLTTFSTLLLLHDLIAVRSQMDGLKQTTKSHHPLIISKVKILPPENALLLCSDNWSAVNTAEILNPH